MVAYVIVERIEEWNAEVFAAYRPLAAASIDKFGGRYLALSTMPVVLEGDTGPIVMAVIEFPSMQLADSWYNSEDYQKAAGIRRAGARNRFIAVDALAP